MKINDIKNALNSKVSALNIRVPNAPVQEEVKPSVEVKPAPVEPIPEEKPAKKEPARKPRAKKVEAPAKVSADNIEVVVAKILKPYSDYGIIPGCKKPSLLKSGAEKLAAYYGYSTSINIENRYENYDKKLVAYEVKVTVTSADGRVIAEGIGAANSLERKFLRGDFFSQINTVLKMCKKRAYVDGILTATGASSIFTQDMEDIGNVQADPEQEVG